MIVEEKSGDWADEDHWPGRLRHAALGFQRHRERFRRRSLREFHHPRINRAAVIDYSGADGLALHGDEPQLVALVRGRRFHPPVAHGHTHFRVVHHANVAFGHARLGRERDGHGVLRFQQSGHVTNFVELLFLFFQIDALLSQFTGEAGVFRPQENRGNRQRNAYRDKYGSPPTAEETAGAFRLGRALRTPRSGAFGRRMDLAHQSFADGGRRLHAGRRESKQSYPPARFRELIRAVGTRGHARFERSFLFAFQNAEGVKVEVFRPSWMSVHDNKFRFKLSTALRMRVFTVPSGSPVLLAISLCVNPSKYASSIAARCSLGRFSNALFTRPSNCCCASAFSKFAGTMTVVSSSSSPPALGLCRRSRDMARLRAITASHPGSEPRAGSNCAALRQS